MSQVKGVRPKKTRAGAGKAAADGSFHPRLDDFESDLLEGTVSIFNSGSTYEWRMHIGEFKPEEIKIWITTSNVQIQAFAETEEETSEFSQDVNLPAEVQIQYMQCTVNEDGVLRILAPVEPQPLNSTTKVVRSSKTTQQVRTETTSESSSRREEEEEEEVEEVVTPEVSDTDPVLDSRFVDSSKDIVRQGDKFEVAFDLHQFKKEDIKVTVHNSVVTVQAKSKPNRSTGKLKLEAFKMFGVPEGANRNSVKTTFKNGQLVISGTAPPEATQQAQQVNIKSVKKTRQQAVVQQKAFLEAKGLGLKQDLVLETLFDLNKEENPADLKDITKQITYENTGSKFEVSFDCAGFSPDDVQVKVFKNMITVRGEQKLGNNEYNENSRFIKKLTIPKGVRPENIQTTFTRNGLLRISSVIDKKGGVTIEEISSVPNNNAEPQKPQQVAIIKPKIQKNDAFYETQMETQTQTSNMQVGPDEGRNFTRTLDISGYEPKDINVTIKNGWITVTGKQVKGVFDTFSDFRNKQFSRQFTLPHGVKPEEINFAINRTDNAHSTLTISVAP